MPYAGDRTTGAEIPPLFFSCAIADNKFKSVFPKECDQIKLFNRFRSIISNACSLAVDGNRIVNLLPFFQATGIITAEFDFLSTDQVEELRKIIKCFLRLLVLILRTYTNSCKMYLFLNEVYEWLLYYLNRLDIRRLATLDFEKKSRLLHIVDAFILANPTNRHVIEMREMLKCLNREKRAFFLSYDPSQVQILSNAVSNIECKITELRSLIESKILTRKSASQITMFFIDYASCILDLAKPLRGLCSHSKPETERVLLKGKKDSFRDRLKLIPLEKDKFDSNIASMNDITRTGGVKWNGTVREIRKMLDLQITRLDKLYEEPTFSVIIDSVVNTAQVNPPLKEIQQTAREFEACFLELEVQDDNDPGVIQALRDRISALLGKK
jgi:hypothetical protein